MDARRPQESNERKVLANLRKIMRAPLAGQESFLEQCEVLAPIDVEFERRPEGFVEQSVDRLYPLDAYRQDLFELLRSRLGHYTANPSDKGNVHALSEIYVYPDASGRAELDRLLNEDDIGYALPPRSVSGQGADVVVSNYGCANLDSSAAKAFVEELCELAKSCRELYCAARNREPEGAIATERSELAGRNKLLLLGHKGVGKTIFLNHVLSIFDEYFDQRGVIWVRTDYTVPAPADITLADRLRWQFLYVLFKYYDLHGERPERKLHFDLDPGNQALMDRIRLASSESDDAKLSMGLRDSKTRVPVEDSPTRVDAAVFKGIYDYLSVDLDVGFVFVVDGLDRFGLTDAQADEFESKLNEVETYVFRKEQHLAAHVLTMRTETAVDFLRRIPYRDVPPRLSVRPVSVRDIYEKRVTYLENNRNLGTRRSFANLRRIEGDNYGRYIREVCEGYLTFIAYGLAQTLDGRSRASVERAFEILDAMFGKDRRLLFDSLRSALWYFLANRRDLRDMVSEAVERANIESTDLASLPGITLNLADMRPDEAQRKYYLFIEALMLRGLAYCLGRYNYVFLTGGDGRTTVALEDDRGEEAIFNFFRFAAEEGIVTRLALLSGVRIVQYLGQHGNRAKRGELVRALHERFGYPTYVLETQLKEMMDSRIIEAGRSITHRSPEAIRLSDKGRFTFDRLAKTLEYLNLAVQSSPLPQSLVAKGLFPIAPYVGRPFVLDNKLVAGVNFARLIAAVDDFERGRLSTKADSQTQEESVPWHPANFEFGREIVRNAERSAARIIKDAYRKGNPGLVRGIEERYLRDPTKYFGEVQGLVKT